VSDISLLCGIGGRLYALPLAHVVETMRPLPIEAMAGTATFVRGLSIIRGVPIPVVDLARLSGEEREARPTRFVTMTTGSRQIALMVEEVVGVRSIPAESLRMLPPLLGALDADIVSAIGTLDAELLLLLHDTHLVPEDVWAHVETGEPAA
jgi:purine-binding chemotaxis protein CheW